MCQELLGSLAVPFCPSAGVAPLTGLSLHWETRAGDGLSTLATVLDLRSGKYVIGKYAPGFDLNDRVEEGHAV